MPLSHLLPLVLLVAAAGCTTTRPATAPPTDLASARARWVDAGAASYAMTLERICYCPEEYRGPYRVTVRDGAVASVTLNGVLTPTDRALTVDDLLDLLAEAVTRDAEQIEVTYDSTRGFPTRLWIDYDARIADEEVGYRVTDLTLATR